MIKKIIPVIVIFIAAGAGMFAGASFGNNPSDNTAAAQSEGATATTNGVDGNHEADPQAESSEHKAPEPAEQSKKSGEVGYFRFPTQFFIPVIRGNHTDSVIVLTLALEYAKESEEEVYKKEHKLRDSLLRTLLIHANTGGFDGNFTLDARMERLHNDLLQSATSVAAPHITDILIEDIIRQ